VDQFTLPSAVAAERRGTFGTPECANLLQVQVSPPFYPGFSLLIHHSKYLVRPESSNPGQ
jgi:hypothetical protein